MSLSNSTNTTSKDIVKGDTETKAKIVRLRQLCHSCDIVCLSQDCYDNNKWVGQLGMLGLLDVNINVVL